MRVFVYTYQKKQRSENQTLGTPALMKPMMKTGHLAGPAAFYDLENL